MRCHLQYRAVDEVFLKESLWRHVVHDVGGQVLEDGVHGVAGLLPGNPQIFLKRSGY